MYDIWERWPDAPGRKIVVHVAEHGSLTCLCGCFTTGSPGKKGLDLRGALAAQMENVLPNPGPYPTKSCVRCRNKLIKLTVLTP